jgi:hypothetical protein
MTPALLLVLVGLATTTTATTTTDAPTTATPATRRLEETRAAFAKLDCDRVIDLATRVEDHRLATATERHEAAFLHGYCAVVIGDNAAAQESFASIFAEDVDAQPPFEMEPRIVVLLDAARSAERERRATAAAAALAARRAQVDLRVERPVDVRGGARAFFPITLRDPPGLVRTVRLEFRRAGETDFYALPVQKKADGSLVGEIPGSYTRSQNGLTLQWFVAAIAADGSVVRSVGSPEAPETLRVGPGSALAQDLRANERLAFATRMSLAVAGTPISSAVTSLAGVAMAGLLLGLGNPALTTLGFMVLPGLGATAGTWFVAQSILDGPDAAIATAVTGGFGVVWALGALGFGVASIDAARSGSVALDGATLVLGLTLALGTVANAAVPATLVALDPATE